MNIFNWLFTIYSILLATSRLWGLPRLSDMPDWVAWGILIIGLLYIVGTFIDTLCVRPKKSPNQQEGG